MRGFGRMGIVGYLADGTPVNAHGQPVAVPAGASGGNVQGRGLVFQYQTPVIASLATGASQSVTIQFDQNSVFNWLRTTVSADVAGDTYDTEQAPLLTLQITDTGNGMSFMNGPIPVGNIAGTAKLPYVLPTPQLIQSNASYAFQWSNFSGTYATGTTYTGIRLQLHGFRIFNVGS